MEKMTLLEKLKTLNQWQLQQQLHFAKLQSDVELTSRSHTSRQDESSLPDKENMQNAGNEPNDMLRLQKQNVGNRFMETMSQNVLTNALQNLDMSELGSDAKDDKSIGEESDNGIGNGLNNWYLSGLQTVKLRSPSECENLSEMESEISDFDDVMIQYESEDGVKPFSETETEDDEAVEDILHGRDDFVSDGGGDRDRVRHVCFDESNREESETDLSGERTVIEVNNEPDPDDKPISSKINGSGLTFECMIENEIGKDMAQDELNTSTPMKKKKYQKNHMRTFLKRGEGLKRFQKGNNAYISKKKKANTKNNNKKLNTGTTANADKIKKAVALTINAPPQHMDAPSKKRGAIKTRPGLPLKLKLKKDGSERDNKEFGSGFDFRQNKLKQTNISGQRTDEELILDTRYTSQSPLPSSNRQAIHPKDSVTSSILEASFQKLIQQYHEKEEKENKDLDDFEALEEAAENMSLSSNSSFVTKLLGRRGVNAAGEGVKKGVTRINGFSAYNNNKPLMHERLNTESDGDQEASSLAQKASVSESDEHRIDDKKGGERRKTSYGDFDDQSTWSDHSDGEDKDDGDDTSIFNNTTEGECNDDTIREASPSPCSSPEVQTPPKRIISKRKERSNSSQTGDSVVETVAVPENISQHLPPPPPLSNVSLTVKHKLVELENEIKTFRAENDKLSKLREQRESEVAKLHKEIQAFQQERKSETERFESYKNEEMKKLKAEKRAFDKYQKAAKAFPNKQEREELKELKEEVERLKSELKTRETRWNSASHRFRSRINELEEGNAELRKEVKILEEQRIERWKRSNQQQQKPSNSKSTNMKQETKYIGNQGNQVDYSPPSQTQDYSPPSQTQMLFSEKHYEKNRQPRESTSPNPRTEFKPNVKPTQPLFESKPQQQQQIENFLQVNNGKKEVLLPDNSKLITFPNGTKKTISADGKTISVCFFNGDIKRILPDQRVVYFYAESQTTHTAFPDGLEILEFSNKQTEKRHTDGRTEIIFPDKTVKYVNTDGSEETVFTDGIVQNVDDAGVRTVLFPNGQREVHTHLFKRREYPNGTVKTVYNDGRQETKYSNGRLRVKDKDGNLVMDSLKT